MESERLQETKIGFRKKKIILALDHELWAKTCLIVFSFYFVRTWDPRFEPVVVVRPAVVGRYIMAACVLRIAVS